MSCHIELPEEGLTLTSSYAKLQVGASRDIYEESGGPWLVLPQEDTCFGTSRIQAINHMNPESLHVKVLAKTIRLKLWW